MPTDNGMNHGERRPMATWISLIVFAVIGAALIHHGWDRGPDVLIDFGRELYVPWRLVEGDVLHRDIAWFNGPLAPWMLEGWMRVFGVSLDALQALNALVIACSTLLLMALLARATSRVTAWAGGLTFLCVFAVAQQEAIGNFHFLTPYSHGITFGFCAGLVALEALARGYDRQRAGWFFVAGLGAGAAFLTKAEISLAVGPSCGVMLLAAALRRGCRGGEQARAFVAFQLGAALMLGLAYARLYAQLDGEGVFQALLGTWPYALDGRASGLDFYREMRGTLNPVASLLRMGTWTASIGAFVAAVLLAAGRLGSRPRAWVAPAAFGLAVILGLGALRLVSIKWLLLPLPMLLGARAIGVLRRWRSTPESEEPHAARLAFLIFALALLPKVLLAPMARQYGFVLAVPGTMVLVALVVHCIPHWASHGTGLRWTRWFAPNDSDLSSRRRTMSAAGLGLVAVFALANLYATHQRFAKKTVTVGSGADQLIAGGFRGTVIEALIRDLDERMAPDQTLLVLPEGIMVNYQLRRRTPTRIVNFMPPELVFFDEHAIVAELAASPPDFVTLIHRPTSDYGHPFFGQGYGEPILSWVMEHYEEVRQIEDDPFDLDPKAFGAAILAKRP